MYLSRREKDSAAANGRKRGETNKREGRAQLWREENEKGTSTIVQELVQAQSGLQLALLNLHLLRGRESLGGLLRRK